MLSWYLENLVCPRDRSSLRSGSAHRLVCGLGHEYPIVDGIPVMLVDEGLQTIDLAHASLRRSRQQGDRTDAEAWHADSLGLSEEEKQAIVRLAASQQSQIDPVVAYLVGATNGIAYKHLIGSLHEYPIPDIRLPAGHGEVFLDLGCSWGRWCLAAARKGYRPIGIDPSLGAVLAAARVARELEVTATFIVGDARHLPLRNASTDVVFSYSVLQHFSRDDASAAVAEAGRVLKPGGRCQVQMPTTLGLRCIYQQARRRFREPHGFEVRYWTLPALRRLFRAAVGPTRVSVDCFFGIGLQASDRNLMPPIQRAAIGASELLRRTAGFFPFLTYVADSVYLTSVKTTGA